MSLFEPIFRIPTSVALVARYPDRSPQPVLPIKQIVSVDGGALPPAHRDVERSLQPQPGRLLLLGVAGAPQEGGQGRLVPSDVQIQVAGWLGDQVVRWSDG